MGADVMGDGGDSERVDGFSKGVTCASRDELRGTNSRTKRLHRR